MSSASIWPRGKTVGMMQEVMYAAFRDELSKIAVFGANFGETLANMAKQTVRAPAAQGMAKGLAAAPAAQSGARMMALKPRVGPRSTMLPPSGGASAMHTPDIPLYSNPPVHHSQLSATMRPQAIGSAATQRPAPPLAMTG